MKERASLIDVFVFVLVTVLSAASVNGEPEGFGQWQILTKQNFSSQIRLHQHLLLLVSVPWSGESRTLMKELTELGSARREEIGSLKLRYLYKNKEKMLADAIGVAAAEEVTFVYFHHSLSYKYQGKLRAKSILSSVLPYMSALPEEIPLKALNTEEELKQFLESTDKALLLLEFCGWTQKVLASGKQNGTENGFGIQGDSSGTNFNGKYYKISSFSGKENQKLQGMENAKLICAIENGFSGIPWLDNFSGVNSSASSIENDTHITENEKPSVGLSCSFEDFQKFDTFFPRFMTLTRDFFLPPEKHRFGLVAERSLLSSLGVGDANSWSVMLYFSGCPSCSKILKDGDDLRSSLQMNEPVIAELDGDGRDLEPVVPSNRPSILLFVDRSSDLLKVRKKSKEALDSLREVALHYKISDLVGRQKDDESERSSIHTKLSGHPKLKVHALAQKIKLKDKMSITIINDGKHAILDNIASDLQGSSLHEILTHLLRRNKEAKLSSVAKEVGFQLLSNDFEIKLADKSASAGEVESSQVSLVSIGEGVVSTSIDPDKGSASNHDERSQTGDIVSSSHDNDEKVAYGDSSQNLIYMKSQQPVSGHGLAISEAVKAEENNSSEVNKLGEEQVYFQSFKGSFFFSDGNYRLLRALTGETRIPSLVIIDPIVQQHYVFPEQLNFSSSSLKTFLHRFLNGSLIPYQRSKSAPENPREGIRPPFINFDFHEADSIPQLTAHTFSEMVLDFNGSYNDNVVHGPTDDIVVLFTNSWCGFCQRMELIVREVYWAMKAYANMLRTRSRDGKTAPTDDNLKNAILKIPKIFLMDCTLNDCSLILKTMDQREVYPTLLLFPAERKTAVPYDGGMAIVDVIKFIADHGSNSQHLANEKGIVWAVDEKGGRNHNFREEDTSPTTIHDAHLAEAKDKSHEVLLRNRMPKKVVEYSRVKSHTSQGLHKRANVGVGSILISTENLVAEPFDKSMVLIVKADQSTRFQGLIYNKPLQWDALNGQEEGLQLLKNAALSFGGPLIIQGKPLVALTRRAAKGQYLEVAQGIYFLDQFDTLREVEEIKSGYQTLSDYWFFLGFSMWGWEQLFDEIAQGAWDLSEHSLNQLHWPSP